MEAELLQLAADIAEKSMLGAISIALVGLVAFIVNNNTKALNALTEAVRTCPLKAKDR